MSLKENPTSVICQATCENQWGNNPAPIVGVAYGVCCDKCNWEFVIPARLGRLSRSNLQYLADAGVLGEESDDACDTENGTVITNEEEE